MAAADKATGSPQLDSPASNAAVITPSASALDYVTRAIYVGGTGHLSVTMQGGQTVLFSAIPAGTWMPIRCTHILAASTATLIVAVW